MALPRRFSLLDLAIATDGGTVFVHGEDESGRKRTISLVQRVNPHRNGPSDRIPGRLYFDGELVPLRSEIEAGVLTLLRESAAREADKLTVTFTTRIIDFVVSDEYLRFAERVESVAGQATDPNRYTVWVACDAESRRQIVVQFARAEGIGLRAAQEHLDRHQPLAEGISALDVPKMAAKYLAAGLTLHVEPCFRWPLSS